MNLGAMYGTTGAPSGPPSVLTGVEPPSKGPVPSGLPWETYVIDPGYKNPVSNALGGLFYAAQTAANRVLLDRSRRAAGLPSVPLSTYRPPDPTFAQDLAGRVGNTLYPRQALFELTGSLIPRGWVVRSAIEGTVGAENARNAIRRALGPSILQSRPVLLETEGDGAQ